MQAMVPAENVTQGPHREHTLLIRLRRLEGQVRGVQRMIEADRECIELVTQLQAISAAADAIAFQLLEEHVREVITAAIDKGADDAAVGDLMQILDRALRRQPHNQVSTGGHRGLVNRWWSLRRKGARG